MKLKLKKPLVFFDLETTGLMLGKDRIVEMSFLKIYPDGHKESHTWLVNPEMPIPAETSAIHGVTDADVAEAPTFKQLAPTLEALLKGADFAGYNSNRFDVPMLADEFLRAGFSFDDKRHFVDVMRIFTLMEKRTLGAAYQFFCGKDLSNAHSAEADVNATYEILESQLDRYSEELKNDVEFLHQFSSDGDFVDFARRMVYENGLETFNFGKYKGKAVKDVLEKDAGYYNWIMKGDFPLQTKQKLQLIKLKYSAKR